MQRYFRFLACVSVLGLVACGSPSSFNNRYATGHYASTAVSCVPYAREVSGLNLRGDADTWWWSAQGVYQRGNRPEKGAVLVLKKTSQMRLGHVAVVKEVLGPRQINVTHSNWGNTNKSRRIIYDSMRVEDVSTANNWTLVRFWNNDMGVMGFPYQAYGFIYP